MAKMDTRKLSQQEQDELRINAIAAWQGGVSQAEVSRRFDVREATVSSWVKEFKISGSKGLISQRRGRRETTLSESDKKRLYKKIVGNTPGQLRLGFALWTTDAVLSLIKVTLKKTVSKSTVHRLLYSWGFTPKKAQRRAWQQDFGKVDEWLNADYPNIAHRAKREKARIFWGDETGLRSDDTTSLGWSPKGERAIMTVNGRRYYCNVISAIDNEGGLAFHVFKDKFNSDKFIYFMERLIEYAKNQKVFLVVDGHPTHKSKAVKAWVKSRSDQIELFILPPYSPELNPDEYLNHDLKASTVRRNPPFNEEHLFSIVRGHLHKRQRQPEIVARFFNAPAVIYAK
jgi:transposase